MTVYNRNKKRDASGAMGASGYGSTSIIIGDNTFDISSLIGNVGWSCLTSDVQNRINAGGSISGDGSILWVDYNLPNSRDIEDALQDGLLPVMYKAERDDTYCYIYSYKYNDGDFNYYVFTGRNENKYVLTDEDDSFSFAPGFTVNGVALDDGDNNTIDFRAGTNMTITQSGNRITFNSSAGGQGTQDIYWVTNSDDDQSISLDALALSKIPIYNISDKYYIYSHSITTPNNLTHLLICEDNTYYRIDRNGVVYGGNYSEPDIQWDNSGTTTKYIPEYVTLGGQTLGAACALDYSYLNATNISSSMIELALALINLPPDFIDGIKNGKYDGVTIGQDHIYSNNGTASSLYIPKGIYRMIGSGQQTIEWTENGQQKIWSADVITMRMAQYNYNYGHTWTYDISIWIKSDGSINIFLSNDEDRT